MLGEDILVRTLTAAKISDDFGNSWQYHSRSDAHSKAACWCVVFDLLYSCSLLQKHVRSGRVGFGINHGMHDFKANRKKKLDLVVCEPDAEGFRSCSLTDLATEYGMQLTEQEADLLQRMPVLRQCPVGAALVALEAKACMTEHVKACPRLHDELSSSFQTINGDNNNTIAAALVILNVAPSFISPGRNMCSLGASPVVVNQHNQPAAAKRVAAKVLDVTRRSNPKESGYDAVGITLISCANNGTPVLLCSGFGDGTAVEPTLSYATMIQRISHTYATRFNAL